jgi:Integrase core domain
MTGAEKRAGVGYVYLHCVIDDHSRYAYVEQHRDQGGDTAAAVLGRAIEHFTALGMKVPEAVMSDNAFAYRRSNAFKAQLAHHGARHILTPPYTPRWKPTPGPAQPSGPGPWHPSFATTTGVVRTALWETGRRSAAFTTSVGRTASAQNDPDARRLAPISADSASLCASGDATVASAKA